MNSYQVNNVKNNEVMLARNLSKQFASINNNLDTHVPDRHLLSFTNAVLTPGIVFQIGHQPFFPDPSPEFY